MPDQSSDERLERLKRNIDSCLAACYESAKCREYPQGACMGEIDNIVALMDDYPDEFEALLERETVRAKELCREMGW